PLTGWIIVVHRRRHTRPNLGADSDRRSDGIEIPHVAFLDLQLHRACPRSSFSARLRVDVIQQAAVPLRFGAVAGRPFLFAPLELELEVVILEGLLRTKFAEDLSGDPDGRASIDVLGDGKDFQRIPTGADWLQVFSRVVTLEPGNV